MRQYVILERREKRPRRLRIGIPIWFTAVVELKYYQIKYHLRRHIILERRKKPPRGPRIGIPI